MDNGQLLLQYSLECRENAALMAVTVGLSTDDAARAQNPL